jgi:hypothetical protein
MTRRARLPGADELFRRTAAQEGDEGDVSRTENAAISPPGTKVTSLQVAKDLDTGAVRGPKHDEKVTFYCTRPELTRLERARLTLRAEHGLPSDRGRIVRAALREILEDFESRGPSSGLVRRLQEVEE